MSGDVLSLPEERRAHGQPVDTLFVDASSGERIQLHVKIADSPDGPWRSMSEGAGSFVCIVPADPDSVPPQLRSSLDIVLADKEVEYAREFGLRRVRHRPT